MLDRYKCVINTALLLYWVLSRNITLAGLDINVRCSVQSPKVLIKLKIVILIYIYSLLSTLIFCACICILSICMCIHHCSIYPPHLSLGICYWFTFKYNRNSSSSLLFCLYHTPHPSSFLMCFICYHKSFHGRCS